MKEGKALNQQRQLHNMARFTLATTFAAAVAVLAACGGGGDDSGTSSGSAVAAAYDPTAFVGTWTALGTTPCVAGFAYNSTYGSKATSVTITATTLSITQTVYTNATCAVKAGKLVESYTVVTTQGVVPGWSNQARMAATFTGSSTSADGGQGVTFTKIPDGSATMSGNGGKFLWAVIGNSLHAGDYTATKDSAGYPQVILSSAAYTK